MEQNFVQINHNRRGTHQSTKHQIDKYLLWRGHTFEQITRTIQKAKNVSPYQDIL